MKDREKTTENLHLKRVRQVVEKNGQIIFNLTRLLESIGNSLENLNSDLKYFLSFFRSIRRDLDKLDRLYRETQELLDETKN